MTKLFKTLESFGIPKKDTQTSGFGMQPQWEYRNNKIPKLVGYQVTNNVTVASDLKNLGTLLSALSKDGSNHMSGISFDVRDKSKFVDQAREAAVADAMHKAELYAKAAKFELGKFKTFSENSHQPTPRHRVMMAEAATMGAARDSVPVAEGELTFTANVNITWELLQNK